jgi:hypothetical protein
MEEIIMSEICRAGEILNHCAVNKEPVEVCQFFENLFMNIISQIAWGQPLAVERNSSNYLLKYGT